ncbi:MAG: FISUMP domain-containing protein [Fibrobacter sp.]|nr:FISUMP domain-containing protein [Fibrobacter sp.]
MLAAFSLTSCIFDDEGESWSAEKVCPDIGTNAYGMPNRGTFTDERDGRVYKYTTIGDQVWMAENLKYELPYPYSMCYGKKTCYWKQRWRGDSVGDTVCVEDTSKLAEIGQRMNTTCTTNECIADEFCERFGRYYNLYENGEKEGFLDRVLLDTICPQGWRVPSKAEWEVLMESVQNDELRLLEEESYDRLDSETKKWYKRPDNSCGYSVPLNGYLFMNGAMQRFSITSAFATTTAKNELFAWNMIMEFGNMAFTSHNFISIRCLKD